jgi:GAF domain-containing protein
MEELGILDAARLSVVQHGTRASFRRRVMDAMRQLVPAAGAFICFGTEDTRAYADSSRLVDGVAHGLKDTDRVRLTQAFGFETKSVVETTRRVYVANELYPDEDRMKLPYFASHADAGMKHALLFFLHEGGVLFGIAGLERREADGPFTEDDVRKLEALGPFVVAGARTQLTYDELSREAVALRAFSKVSGTLFVVDRERKKVLWAANRERGIEWENDVLPIEDHVVDAAEQSLQARAKQEALPTPPRLPTSTASFRRSTRC